MLLTYTALFTALFWVGGGWMRMMPQLSLYRVTSGPINKISKISEGTLFTNNKNLLRDLFFPMQDGDGTWEDEYQ